MTDNLLPDGIGEPTSYLNDLVGEGKKFRDLEALAYGKHQSDTYIKTLERKLDQLKDDYAEARTELQSRAKFEELADRIARPREPVYESKPEVKPERDIEDIIADKVQKQMIEQDRLAKQRRNLNDVRTKLAETFGEANIESKLKEIGLDGQSGAEVAKNNPQLVLKALGVDKPPVQPQFQPPPHNVGFNQKPEQKRTWAYYQELYKNDPKLKFDRATNVQMQKDYIALGTAFEDGDFNRFG